MAGKGKTGRTYKKVDITQSRANDAHARGLTFRQFAAELGLSSNIAQREAARCGVVWARQSDGVKSLKVRLDLTQRQIDEHAAAGLTIEQVADVFGTSYDVLRREMRRCHIAWFPQERALLALGRWHKV